MGRIATQSLQFGVDLSNDGCMYSAGNLPSAEQKGHAFVLLILLVAALAVVFFIRPSHQGTTVPVQNRQQDQLYIDPGLKFKFKYPAADVVVSETEEEYSKRTQTQYRKNFAGYVQYQPPKFFKSLIVKPKDLHLGSSQFDSIPLTVWVFENPQKLDAANWYRNYWYYPFVWGIFSEPQKGQIAPKMEATVSGILTRSATVGYSPGKPKFILLPKDDRMYLFKVMTGGDQILNSFKFD